MIKRSIVEREWFCVPKSTSISSSAVTGCFYTAKFQKLPDFKSIEWKTSGHTFWKNAWHYPLGKSICTYATAEAATSEAKRLTCARNGHTYCTQDMQPIQRVGYQNLRVVCFRPNWHKELSLPERKHFYHLSELKCLYLWTDRSGRSVLTSDKWQV